MGSVDEIRLILPPGTAPRLRLHPLLQAPGLAADVTDDELRLTGAARTGVAADLAAVLPLRLKTPLGRPRHAADLHLLPDLPLAAALRAVFAETVSHLTDNVAAAATGEIEAVHQARVAIRRLRAALLLFRPLLDPTRAAAFNEEFRALGHALGGARDWDVFLQETWPTLEAAFADEAPWLRRLHAAATEARTKARAAMADTLAAPAFTQLVLGFKRWIEENPPEHSNRPLARAAGPLLDRLEHRLQRRGQHFTAATADELHALRKSLKKLRYALEFLHSLYPYEAVHPTLHAIKALQSALGAVNDARVLMDLLGHLVAHRRLDATASLGRVALWAGSSAAASLSDATPRWAAFRALEAPWRA